MGAGVCVGLVIISGVAANISPDEPASRCVDLDTAWGGIGLTPLATASRKDRDAPTIDLSADLAAKWPTPGMIMFPPGIIDPTP
jgi:hypothetical protein